MKIENSQFIQISNQVFKSPTLSKGAKLLFGALHVQRGCAVDERQPELPLGLPALPIKVVKYEPAELAVYMQCGLATVRKYVKELGAAGFVNFYAGKLRGKNRRLVLQLEVPLIVEVPQKTLKIKHPSSSLIPLPLVEEEEVAPQLEVSSTLRSLEAIPAVLQETADPKDSDQLFLEMKVATAKVTKRVFAKGMLPIEYIFAPLTLEDLQILWSSWDAHNPELCGTDMDQNLQSHLDAVKTSQEPYCEMRVGKMYHLYTGALCLHREMQSQAQV